MERQAKKGAIPLKICGLTRAGDIAAAAALGVVYAGFNFYRGSKRYVDPKVARKAWREAMAVLVATGRRSPKLVGVIVDLSVADLARVVADFPEIEFLQFHGEETAGELLAHRRNLGGRGIWKAVGVASAEDVAQKAQEFQGAADLILFDSAKIPAAARVMGGSGVPFDWRWLSAYDGKIPFGVAGGVTAENAAALLQLSPLPALADAASGSENGVPGVKDHGRIASLMSALFGAGTAVAKILVVFLLSQTAFAQGEPPPPSAASPAPGPASNSLDVPTIPQEAVEDDEVSDSSDETPDAGSNAEAGVPVPEAPKAAKKNTSVLPLNIPVPSSIPSAAEVHRWDRYVRGFRREHNFAFSVGLSRGTWDVRHFGTLENKKYFNSGVFSRFQYSFHLPLVAGFGYMLGSSFGYHYESTDKRRAFQSVPALMFPGLLAGFVENFSPVVRWSAALDIYLERLNGLSEHDGIAPDPDIYVTMEAFDFGTFFDLFYDLEWAVRFEAHHRHSEYLQPLCASGGDCRHDYPVNANIKKDDDWFGLGLVLHLL